MTVDEVVANPNPTYPGDSDMLYAPVTGLNLGSGPILSLITSTSTKIRQPSLSGAGLSPNSEPERSQRPKMKDHQAKSAVLSVDSLVPRYGGYNNNNNGQDTSKNSSVMFCRICHEGESVGERLISPCRCSGSVGLIHRTCIEKWLTIVNNDTCELCKEKYSVSRHPRPFSSWLCEPAVGDDQRNLVGDGVCFVLLTPLAVISAYLCASGAAYYFQQDKKSEAIGLICLSSLLVLIYMAWLVLTIRYHCQVWFKWRVNNQDIRLLNVSGQIASSSRIRHLDQGLSSLHNIAVPVPDDEILDTEELDTESAVVRMWDDLDANVAKSNSLCSASSQDYSNTADILAAKSGLSETADNKRVSVVGNTEPCCTPTPPLSPCIISSNPQDRSLSKVVATTEDSVIYQQISLPQEKNKEQPSQFDSTHFPLDHQLSIHNRAVSVPYLPDLKEHFIALRSRPDSEITKSAKSRGTFSPSLRLKNVTFSVTPVSTPTPIQPQPREAVVTRTKPLPPPVPARRS